MLLLKMPTMGGPMSAETRARRERERRLLLRAQEGHRQFMQKFETIMRDTRLAVCNSCREERYTHLIRRGTCFRCSKNPTRAHLFSHANLMDLGRIPSELQGLTMVEQVLIARVHPIVSVFRIRGQQRAYSGHVMNFVQHVEAFAARLSNMASLDSLIIQGVPKMAG